MAKTQYLTFEIHLNDSDQVAALQATTTGVAVRPQIIEGKLFQAPFSPASPTYPLGLGAAVDYGTAEVPVLPMIGPGDAAPVGTPYLFSEWFTSANSYPRDFASFTRKSGGWFGISSLFGTTTRYFWRGVFVYDAPEDSATGGPGAREAIMERRWIDTFQLWEGQVSSESGGQTTAQQRWMSRDAARAVDGLGFAMRGEGGVRIKTVTGDVGGGASTEDKTWERLYIRLRKLPATSVDFWRSRSQVSVLAGGQLQITPTGQIAVYNITQLGVASLLGTTAALDLDRWYKLDLLVDYNPDAALGSGALTVVLNGLQALTVSIASTAGGMGQNQARHASSEIGAAAGGHTLEMDFGFWMGAKRPLFQNGLDWVNGSRAVIIRPNGMSADNANWSTDWRLLMQRPARAGGASVEGALSTTSGGVLGLTTDVATSVDAVPGSLGCVAFKVALYGYRGTSNGTIGYKLAGVDALSAIVQNASPTLGWNGKFYHPAGMLAPTAISDLQLKHVKGADVDEARATIFMAVAEIIGTFGDEDYYPGTDPALVLPLPFLGIHNAPYPRTPWARTASPPQSPVVITSGTYNGNSVGQELTFRSPVHFLWIRRIATAAGSPKTVRWWSSKLGASQAHEESPLPWFVPDQLIDPSFVSATPSAPTGVGAFPDRSAEVAAIVALHLDLLDGSDTQKRYLCALIARELNSTIPADGDNWGLLEKQERTPPFVATDILVWKPTLDHVDILTDTGATWNENGIITNPSWVWKSAGSEGVQEQQTIIRIAGSSVEVNQTGQSYQYVAISDPGQRYMLNGASAHSTQSLPAIHALIDAGFTPVWGWFQDEHPGTSTANRSAIKGPGNAAASITKLDGTQLATAVTFGAGSLTLNTGAIFTGTDFALNFALFRAIEPDSVDPGRFDVVRVTSYVGNGAGGTRTIPLPNASGKRPLAAWVFPHTSQGWYKDATHTGGNSSSVQDGSQATTAIATGAADEIVVGTTLNVNLVTYNVFVIMGGETAGADGFSINGEFIPVEPESPTAGAQWGEDGEEPPDDEGESEEGETGSDTPGDPGGGADDMETDLSTLCKPYTQRLADIALGKIGHSRRLSDLATDVTTEALQIRLHWAHAVEQTLRDYPWPFATREAILTLLAGSTTSPVSRDWTYSYSRPTDCVFERRIVVVREGAVDPAAPPFQLSFDNSTMLNRILTNQATARLEYTARPECVASQGDPLFVEALTWKLAQLIAPAVSKMADREKYCQERYDECVFVKAPAVIKPGNPGPRATTTPDVLAAHQAANVTAINRGLVRIGVKSIANMLSEQSPAAEAVRLIFEDELRAVLRDHDWAFATAYADTLTLIEGTATEPVNDDWTYAYRLPTDCVRLRRLINPGLKRGFDPAPPPYRIGQDATGLLFYCDLEDPTIEYTARLAGIVALGDAIFRDALAWRFGACLAPSLATIDPSVPEQHGRGPQTKASERKPTEAQLRARAADYAWRKYADAISTAQTADMNEAEPQDPDGDGDPDWIRGRN